jgi:hypothetical protein
VIEKLRKEINVLGSHLYKKEKGDRAEQIDLLTSVPDCRL